MSLIALTTDPILGPRSVVTSASDFKKDGTAVLIQHGDLTALSADSKECNDGYDLRVGSEFRDHRNEYAEVLEPEGTINLQPGNAVIIQTEESVEFPASRFGQIFPKVRLLQKGIANTPSKVDLGFQGHLLITVFNYGKRRVPLRRGQRFCSLHIFNIEGPVQPYKKDPPDIGERQRPSWMQKFGDWTEAKVPRFVEILAIVLTALFTVIDHFSHR